MPIQPVSGDIKAQPLNNNFSYLDSKVDQVSGGPKETFTSVTALQAKYPNGNNSAMLVTDSNGANGYLYTWNSSSWVKGPLYQAQGIGEGTVVRTNFTETVTLELNKYAENNINKCFEILHADYIQAGETLVNYSNYLGSISDLILIGFDSSKEHRLRILARNHPTFNYRFIICSRNSSADAWTDVFDTTSSFKVTENVNGVTSVYASIGTKEVSFKMDYTTMRSGASFNDGALGANEGRYKIKDSCFYQNTSQYAVDEIQRLEAMLNTLDVSGIVGNKNGTSLKVKYQRKAGLNEVIDFDELGINKIIHPKRIYRETADSLTTSFENLNLYNTLITDWISPYSNVKALTNPLNNNSFTVGGNHGSNGLDGVATAKNLSADLYVDGKLVKDGDTSAGKEATIVVRNMISAPNQINLTTGQKADSFEETVVYRVTKNSIEVAVSIKALERISIANYVGLQMTTDILQNAKVYFLDTAAKYSPDGVLHNSASLPFNNDRFVYANDTDLIVTRTNRSIGIGDLRYKNTASIHFLSEFNKIYSHLVNEPVVLEIGSELFYAGSYTFMEKMICDGAEKAYFYKEHGETIYCVDFFNAVSETKLKLPDYELGKKVAIVDSKNVTADSFVTGSGLRLISNGLGYIKFKLK